MTSTVNPTWYLSELSTGGPVTLCRIGGGSVVVNSFSVSSTGLVGVGTTSPAYTLDVAGNINFTGNLYKSGSLFKTSQWYDGSGSTISYSAGNVGIGTTAPQAPLHLYGTGSWISIGTASAANNQAQIGFVQNVSGSASNYGYLAINNTGNILTWNGGGNVGLGTSTPVTQLEVYGGAFAATTWTRTAASTNYGVGTQYSLISATGAFRGYYARTFGGAQTIATSAQSQAVGYFAIDCANSGSFASDADVLTSLAYFSPARVGISSTVVDIRSEDRTGTHGSGPLYVTGNIGGSANGVEFRHSNGTQGIGIGYNSLYATGSSTNQDLSLVPRGSGNVYVSPNNLIVSSGSIGVGTASPLGSLQLGTNLAVSNGSLIVGRNNGVGGNRNVKLAYDDSFYFSIGDFMSSTWIPQLRVYYNAPQNAIVAGQYTTQFNADTSSMSTTPNFEILGRTGFDGSNVVNIQCQSSQYGRNQLIMTGRYENNNDGWSLTTPRNAIIFKTQSSLNSAATTQFTIQNYGNLLGIMCANGGDSPKFVVDANGYIGVGTGSPSYPLTVSTGNNTAGFAHTTGTVTIASWADSSRGGFLGTISNHSLLFYTNNGGAQMALTTAGNLGINTVSPASRLHVNADGDVSSGLLVTNITAHDVNSRNLLSVSWNGSLPPCMYSSYMYFYASTGYTPYRIIQTASTYFTGQHANQPIEEEQTLKTEVANYVGLIVSSADRGCYSINPMTKEVLTGKAAIMISEALPYIKLTDKDMDKAVWGVVTNVKNDNYNVDGTVETDDNTQWGDRLDSMVRVNGLGEGGIWVTNINGPLENGDLICSSRIPGYGRRQDDDLFHNYTVGKSTMSCAFDLDNDDKYECHELQYEVDGVITTFRKAFISCTYHCS